MLHPVTQDGHGQDRRIIASFARRRARRAGASEVVAGGHRVFQNVLRSQVTAIRSVRERRSDPWTENGLTI